MIGFVVVVFGIAVALVIAHENAKAKTHKIYRSSLEELRANPKNGALRQQTLTLGRAYSNLTRNRWGVATYDETAVRNDIDAATAGSVDALK